MRRRRISAARNRAQQSTSRAFAAAGFGQQQEQQRFWESCNHFFAILSLFFCCWSFLSSRQWRRLSKMTLGMTVRVFHLLLLLPFTNYNLLLLNLFDCSFFSVGSFALLHRCHRPRRYLGVMVFSVGSFSYRYMRGLRSIANEANCLLLSYSHSYLYSFLFLPWDHHGWHSSTFADISDNKGGNEGNLDDT